MLASRKSREAYDPSKARVTEEMLRKSPKSVREFLVVADSQIAEDERKIRDELEQMRSLEQRGQTTSIKLHRTLLVSIRSGLVGMSDEDRQELEAFIRADSTFVGRLGYDLGLYPFSWWFIARLAAWAVFAFVCGRLADKFQKSRMAWSFAGFVFGPFALLALILLRERRPGSISIT